MTDYGNARIAARRARLPDATEIEALVQAGSVAGALAHLERRAEWAELLRTVRPAARDAATAMELAVERFRAGELAALPAWYRGSTRRLVEALVMDLDRERVVAILRRRRSGQEAEAINPTIAGGALLGGQRLAELARLPTLEAIDRRLVGWCLLLPGDARQLVALATASAHAEHEAALEAAWHRSRLWRARGGGVHAAAVRRHVDDERAARETAVADLLAGGAGVGALVERTLRVAWLERVAATGHREPLGIGPVAAFVAAVELAALRLRTVLARLAAGWSSEMARAYLARAEA